MLRNYNGNVNRSTLRDLRRICDANTDNLKNFLEAFARNGQVSFHTNTFMGMVDEMSEEHILRSEEEIMEYLKQDAAERFEGYMRDKDIDYLVASVLEFCRANGKYPNIDEMRELEKEAESKRVAELPAGTATAETPQTVDEAMHEIMDLAEEIFESRRITNPDDIFCPVEPYHDRLQVESGDFSGLIEWDSYYGNGDSTDYHVRGQIRGNHDLNGVSFYRHYDGTASASAENWRDERVDLTTEHVISVHKSMVDLAEQEGIEFLSEIDYEQLV